MDIRLTESDRGGRFELVDAEGSTVASMTFQRSGPSHVLVDRTFTDPAHRGRGDGRRLFEAMVDWARQTGTKVSTTCWFVAKMFNQDAARADVYEPPG